MSSERTKPVMIGIAVVCLIVAGILLFINLGSSPSSSSNIESIPMICVACGHTYELSAKQFREQMAQQRPDMMMAYKEILLSIQESDSQAE